MINLPETKRRGVCFSTLIDFCQLEEEGLFSDSSCARPQVKNRDKISNARKQLKRHFVKQIIGEYHFSSEEFAVDFVLECFSPRREGFLSERRNFRDLWHLNLGENERML
ncbi:hypothetical protein TNIN_231231 [Trichonephila inaurata madagascariensis]|uniref:Uncharacterized protein n=1 Tax=Trichonephila inaurata madagascariensis TaxID=2747483 RepID=A0A8X6XV72_9ARAC|nr:hypothetical protein TNIN_231231 [Trichonephila inaurata madagascariensis]